jgi:hypothetical protein
MSKISVPAYRSLRCRQQGPLGTVRDSPFSHRSLPKSAPTLGKTPTGTDRDRYFQLGCISKIAHARGGGFYLKQQLSVPATLFELPPDPVPHPEGGWLPEWLAAEIRAGHGNAYRTYAVWTRCAKCAAIILTGLDDPCVAANAAVDPTPLTPVQELICTLEYRPTYRLHLAGTGARIQHRDQWNGRTPAGTKGKPPVVPSHRCEHRFPGIIDPPETERQSDGKPPF